MRDVVPLLGAVAAALWLTMAPEVIGYGGPARGLHQVAGPILASIACVSCWEVSRALRWLAVALAVLMAVVTLMPPFLSTAAAIDGVASAGLVAALCARTPPARARYGGGWLALL